MMVEESRIISARIASLEFGNWPCAVSLGRRKECRAKIALNDRPRDWLLELDVSVSDTRPADSQRSPEEPGPA